MFKIKHNYLYVLDIKVLLRLQIIICIVITIISGVKNVNALIYNYSFDTSESYKLITSFVKIFESNMENISDYDLHKFYLVLSEVFYHPNDYLTQSNIMSLLSNHGINYNQSTLNERYIISSLELEYDNFDFDLESKRINIKFEGVNYFKYIAGWEYYFDGDVCPFDFVEVFEPLLVLSVQKDDVIIDGQVLPPIEGQIKCKALHTHEQVILNGNRREIITKYFQRYYFANEEQTQYGYPIGYQSKFSIYYHDLNILLIDDDKLMLSKKGTSFIPIISKYKHYKRNNNQLNVFPTKIDSSVETIPAVLSSVTGLNCYRQNSFIIGNFYDKAAYFHQLGYYNGDRSNYTNKKFVCDFGNSSYEAVYDINGNLVTNPLIMGTYNFDRSDQHFDKDVIPYLIWGNKEDDPSHVIERFIWDIDNQPFLSDSYLNLELSFRRFRGSDLMDKAIENKYLSDRLLKELLNIFIRLGGLR